MFCSIAVTDRRNFAELSNLQFNTLCNEKDTKMSENWSKKARILGENENASSCERKIESWRGPPTLPPFKNCKTRSSARFPLLVFRALITSNLLFHQKHDFRKVKYVRWRWIHLVRVKRWRQRRRRGSFSCVSCNRCAIGDRWKRSRWQNGRSYCGSIPTTWWRSSWIGSRTVGNSILYWN